MAVAHLLPLFFLTPIFTPDPEILMCPWLRTQIKMHKHTYMGDFVQFHTRVWEGMFMLDLISISVWESELQVKHS